MKIKKLTAMTLSCLMLHQMPVALASKHSAGEDGKRIFRYFHETNVGIKEAHVQYLFLKEQLGSLVSRINQTVTEAETTGAINGEKVTADQLAAFKSFQSFIQKRKEIFEDLLNDSDLERLKNDPSFAREMSNKMNELTLSIKQASEELYGFFILFLGISAVSFSLFYLIGNLIHGKRDKVPYFKIPTDDENSLNKMHCPGIMGAPTARFELVDLGDQVKVIGKVEKMSDLFRHDGDFVNLPNPEDKNVVFEYTVPKKDWRSNYTFSIGTAFNDMVNRKVYLDGERVDTNENVTQVQFGLSNYQGRHRHLKYPGTNTYNPYFNTTLHLTFHKEYRWYTRSPDHSTSQAALHCPKLRDFTNRYLKMVGHDRFQH